MDTTQHSAAYRRSYGAAQRLTGNVQWGRINYKMLQVMPLPHVYASEFTDHQSVSFERMSNSDIINRNSRCRVVRRRRLSVSCDSYIL